MRACFICQLCQNCTSTVSKWDNGYRVPFYPFLWQTHFRLLRYKRDIISISQKEKKKSVRFSGKLIPVSGQMFCGYQGATNRADQSVDLTALSVNLTQLCEVLRFIYQYLLIVTAVVYLLIQLVICKMSRGVKHAKTDQININKIKKRF